MSVLSTPQENIPDRIQDRSERSIFSYVAHICKTYVFLVLWTSSILQAILQHSTSMSPLMGNIKLLSFVHRL